ncbi:YciI family protein [bacterium]|nr:YciI family protein [bacterium]
MRYMLLIYEDDAERVDRMDERMPTCAAYAETMRKAGIYVCGERLRGAGTATSVRLVDGRTTVVDGPYAEAKEQLGGFHIIDVPDLDTALAWAARCPSASRGVVEVRPIWPLP